jgi:hypothetical protein
MIRDELQRKIGELYGQVYWHDRGTFPVENVQLIRKELAILEWQMAAGEYEPEINSRGNIIERSFNGQTDRYHFDFDVCKSWKQFDTKQDASYFGVWVNIEKRQTLTYCEGDITLVICPTIESFRAELEDLEKFYGPQPPAWIGCDGIGMVDGKISPEGNVTYYYDERPKV